MVGLSLGKTKAVLGRLRTCFDLSELDKKTPTERRVFDSSSNAYYRYNEIRLNSFTKFNEVYLIASLDGVEIWKLEHVQKKNKHKSLQEMDQDDINDMVRNVSKDTNCLGALVDSFLNGKSSMGKIFYDFSGSHSPYIANPSYTKAVGNIEITVSSDSNTEETRWTINKKGLASIFREN